MVKFEDFSALCLEHITQENEKNHLFPKIGVDDDLFTLSIIDSFGFIDLLLLVEEITGVFIDITEHDVSEFSTIRKLFLLSTSEK